MTPDAATDVELLRVHHPEYLEKVISGTLTDREVRRIGLPWSPELVERSRRSVGGTIEACRSALLDGIAVSLSGGTHHAFPDHGAGYCIFNDVAVAVRAMQAEGRARRIVVVDCDVHQGDGTAAIFAGDSSVFTFSIHGAKNFPLHKERSDLDVESAGRRQVMRIIWTPWRSAWNAAWPWRAPTWRSTLPAQTRTWAIPWAGWRSARKDWPRATGWCSTNAAAPACPSQS